MEGFYLILIFRKIQMIFAIVFLIFISDNIYGQDSRLSGNIFFDQKSSFSETYSENHENIEGKKSPFLSALMSFAVPGLGQFYSKNYLKASIYLFAEATAITVGLIYDNKGDNQTLVFQKYANAKWDVAKYARWTIDNLEGHLNVVMGNNLKASDYSDLFLDQARTKVNWDALNRLESDIGGWYSHRLERFGEQQYYEMIGKYPQFNPGWDDFDENYLFTYTNSKKDPVTPHFDGYSRMRGKANSYYNVASKAVIVVIVNHFLSAIDAAWSTSQYNENIHSGLSIDKINIGYETEYFTKLNIQFNF
jgi:hypothetical protein